MAQVDGTTRRALGGTRVTSPFTRQPPPPPPTPRGLGATARALARDAFGREIPEPQQPSQPFDPTASDGGAKPKREAATESIGRRAGALSDELDFPEFVA